MKRFILLSFLVLGWGYWEMSGGTAFVPQAPMTIAQAAPQAEMPGTDQPSLGGVEIATRADTTALDALAAAPGDGDAIVTDALLAEVLASTETPDAPLAPEEAVFRSLATPLEGTPAVQTAAAPALPALREVAGDRVNMRDGPGRNFDVIDQLTRGMLAEVLEENGTGWVRVQVEATGATGWMSADFLTPVNG